MATIVQNLRDREESFYCLRLENIVQKAEIFCRKFNGSVLYAVKCNPHPWVLKAVYRGGVDNFEVASLAEIRQLHTLFPQAGLHYMHPVKPRKSITLGYRAYGVRNFAFDDAAELDKILQATDYPQNLGLFLRIAVSPRGAVLDLSKRFGVSLEEAPSLLKTARKHSLRLGICFHVGSQCLEPEAFGHALQRVDQVIEQAGVKVDVIDVGGGFPVPYPGMTPPPLDDFFTVIHSHLKQDAHLWCEPGRALVAEAGSLVVQVLARRDRVLFINDGVFGGLADAGVPHCFRYPARPLIHAQPDIERKPLLPFSFSGPTCDGYDDMPGPFWLPETVAEGDWIELGQLGAYSASMRSQFHGFQGFEQVTYTAVSDPPLIEMPQSAA